MGRFDSSLTRAAPVFNKLMDRDPSGLSWVNPLLRLAEPECSVLPDIKPIIEWGWGTTEHGLRPPTTLLEWLVRNPNSLRLEGLKQSRGRTRRLRELLIGGDCEVQCKALDRLQKPHRDRAWFVFEGVTKPDVYLETQNAIIVIEGKRTEADITRYTTWMPVRHQMLRHIDSAWDKRGGRVVLGMFVVEANGGDVEVPQRWREVCAETVRPDVVDSSLPHRSPAERNEIAKAYIGVTTWQ
jgi:hypothetical protein